MAKTITLLDGRLDLLAAFEPSPFPFVSLYVNTQADEHGRDNFESWLKKELTSRAKSYPARSEERQSIDKDAARIQTYMRGDLEPSTNGVAIFACAGENDFFEAVQLTAPIERNELYLWNQPHLYTLARLNDQFPRYAAVVADTNSARIFVFGLSTTLGAGEIESAKTRRTKVGGWSQARYQRHIENYHLQHAKELVDRLSRIVRNENIQHVLFAGDPVIISALREQLTPELAEKLFEIPTLDIRTPEHEVLATTLEKMRELDGRTDAQAVDGMLAALRSTGLGVIGVRDVLSALEMGQVDELFLSAMPDRIETSAREVESSMATAVPEPPIAGDGEDTLTSMVADQLVTRARQTGAAVRFIENPDLLAPVGGVGATLRFSL